MSVGSVGGATAPRPRRGRLSTVEGPRVPGGGRDLGALRARRARGAPALTRPASLRPRSMGRAYARAASGEGTPASGPWLPRQRLSPRVASPDRPGAVTAVATAEVRVRARHRYLQKTRVQRHSLRGPTRHSARGIRSRYAITRRSGAARVRRQPQTPRHRTDRSIVTTTRRPPRLTGARPSHAASPRPEDHLN